LSGPSHDSAIVIVSVPMWRQRSDAISPGRAPKLSALLGHADAATTAIYIRPESSRAAVDPRAILGGTVSAPSAQASDREPD
jgi:hypothetical protein